MSAVSLRQVIGSLAALVKRQSNAWKAEIQRGCPPAKIVPRARLKTSSADQNRQPKPAPVKKSSASSFSPAPMRQSIWKLFPKR